MRNRFVMLAVLASAVILAGCAKPPQVEIDGAKSALDTASNAEVERYAPESLAAAREASAQLNAELSAQQEKMALTRNYDKSKELAAAATRAAEKAAADGKAAKERSRQEATAMIAETRQAVADVQGMLDTMPKGKGTAADIAAIQADVAGASESLAGLDDTFARGDYLEAKAKAQSIREIAERSRMEIERAKELAQAKR